MRPLTSCGGRGAVAARVTNCHRVTLLRGMRHLCGRDPSTRLTWSATGGHLPTITSAIESRDTYKSGSTAPCCATTACSAEEFVSSILTKLPENPGVFSNRPQCGHYFSTEAQQVETGAAGWALVAAAGLPVVATSVCDRQRKRAMWRRRGGGWSITLAYNEHRDRAPYSVCVPRDAGLRSFGSIDLCYGFPWSLGTSTANAELTVPMIFSL